MLEVVTFPEAEVPWHLLVEVARLQDLAWPPDGPAEPEPGEPKPPGLRHDPALRPVSMILLDSGAVVAALDILSKEIVHRGERFQARGLSTVVTDPARRRRGLGKVLVVAAREAIEAGGADLGIFTCDRDLRPFYEAAGWECLAGTVLIGGTPEAPFPSDRFDKVTMARFFSARARAARAGFVGARIELYPGVIDKLW